MGHFEQSKLDTFNLSMIFIIGKLIIRADDQAHRYLTVFEPFYQIMDLDVTA